MLEGGVRQDRRNTAASTLLQRVLRFEYKVASPDQCISENPHPDAGSDGETLRMVPEHVLFIPVPGSNKVTTKVTLGLAVGGIL